jgi:predicted metal-dependent HD superfamily phosphohydrolase
MQHLSEGFDFYDALPNLPGKGILVEFAFWFHDFAYDPTSNTNEGESAVLADYLLEDAGVPSDISYDSARLIFDTSHKKIVVGTEGRLLADIDLWILGAPWDRFAEYEGQIREEYFFVPEDQFRAGRIAVLKHLLPPKKRHIYYTPEIRELLEDQACSNIERSIVALEK